MQKSRYPKISIVTPSYNQGKYIEKTILSILNQNYPELEYVIIDGNSSDGTVDIIRKYERYLHHWVSEKDTGQTNAINKGFSKCTGDVLNWINADDCLMPDALNSVAKAFNAYPYAGAWIGCCNLRDISGHLLDTNVPRGLTARKMVDWGFKGHFFQPACFLSRKAWENSGPLDESLQCCFDLDLYLKIISSYKFVAVGKIWTEALIHENAKTQKLNHIMKQEIALIKKRYGYKNSDINYNEEKIMYDFLKPGPLRTLFVKIYKTGLRNLYNMRLKLSKFRH